MINKEWGTGDLVKEELHTSLVKREEGTGESRRFTHEWQEGTKRSHDLKEWRKGSSHGERWEGTSLVKREWGTEEEEELCTQVAEGTRRGL